MNSRIVVSRTVGSGLRINGALFSVGALMLVASTARADIYTVTNLADSGAGSLRQAVTSAKANNAANQIVFAKGVTGTISLTSALPTLTGALTISGPGANVLTVARSAAAATPKFRVFSTAGSAISLSGLTIANGLIEVVTAPSPNLGAGIFNTGSLTIDRCVLSNNQAITSVVFTPSGPPSFGGGGLGLPGNGGGHGSLVTYFGMGGGIFNSGLLSITNSSITNNLAYYGAGCYNAGSMTITNSALDNNTAAEGPGFYLGTQLVVVYGYGGGLANTGSMSLISSNVEGNAAFTGDGGGVYNSTSAAVLTIQYSTVANNTHENVVNNGGKVIYK